MRICYISLQEFQHGTAGYTHVFEIVRGLQLEGIEVDLRIPSYDSVPRRPLALAKVALKFQLRLARQWISAKRPDLLYVRHHYAALPITMAAWMLRIPVASEVNGPFEDFVEAWRIQGIFVPLVRLAAMFQLRLGRRTIAVTPGLAQRVVDQFGLEPTKVSTIQNGVNTDLFTPMSDSDIAAWPELNGKEFVLFIGALSQWQGLETMIEALDLASWPSELSIVIAGRGRLKDLVEESASERLIYLGPVEYEKVPYLINASIAGLCLIADPARSEIGVSPLKLYEYLACGRPVIATHYPGLSDLVTEAQCGLIIAPDDPEALSAAADRLHRKVTEREAMGRSGADLVRNGFSWRHRVQETLDILRRVVG